MQRGRTLVAVEVKTRPQRAQGLMALTPASRKRLERALEFSLTRWPQYACLDLDLHLIVVSPWRVPLHLCHL
jgi:putative endonuclease